MPINIKSIFKINVSSSEPLTEWLNHPNSLTDKLYQIKGDARIQLLSQSWTYTDWWDRYLLQIPDERVFQREIIMKSHGIPYWYARSIIPKKCYELDPVFFGRLQNESIKNLIFDREKVSRLQCINYPVDQRCLEYYWVKKNLDVTGVLWLRLAEFSFQHKESFYLVEIMLPELETITP
ncbi:chorismate lyase [Fluoribacter dumoffii]|uniref:chorismate--pyruvate lyase family protein n=1 Tax=Fluoribacter dumoffii TaxID=463 RepID=UPI002243EE14|nr:chorismate lyase [Fluoribacter dumoffii]MCW8385763.1 chorismate lyase [Fluoribacter dumoffii]MCW8418792.1 chorismate lyase [Fluoribacter dumoffii]MCW8453364.1 chorismate lyase [Fluoribacter dumoffii]MCW8459415.1 chorismate lyase [Fluoribacter dumoffii]MCW8482775.1 chorismate lyase [Fluoribacter dumoffii]